ncbi:MAG: hypothetical protein H7Y19_17465 [Luteimonas sp.]|nr:hypothetical protein [Luteimonas sp.]
MRSIHHPRSAQRDDYPNPLFRAMAAHPLGVVAGAVIGAAAGLLVVSLFAGATATLVGAVIGVLAGVTIAAGIAERSDRSHRSDDANRHDANDRYFAGRFEQAHYRRHDQTFEDYRPAYHYGLHARTQRGAVIWDDALERELASEWHLHRGDSKLDWDQARAGVYEAFNAEFNANAPVNERFRVG